MEGNLAKKKSSVSDENFVLLHTNIYVFVYVEVTKSDQDEEQEVKQSMKNRN